MRKSELKRTPFKPRTKPMATGLTGALRVNSFARKPGKKMLSKPKAISKLHRDHFMRVAALPCAECGIEGFSQCAHANSYEYGKGAGKKADYLNTFPLCCTRVLKIGCHVIFDQKVGITKEEARIREAGYIRDTHIKLGITK